MTRANFSYKNLARITRYIRDVPLLHSDLVLCSGDAVDAKNSKKNLLVVPGNYPRAVPDTHGDAMHRISRGHHFFFVLGIMIPGDRMHQADSGTSKRLVKLLVCVICTLARRLLIRSTSWTGA